MFKKRISDKKVCKKKKITCPMTSEEYEMMLQAEEEFDTEEEDMIIFNAEMDEDDPYFW